jgi:hypothetical protein
VMPRADGLVPGEAFLVVQLFDRSGYYSSVLGRTPLDLAREAAKRSMGKYLVFCTMPFEGRWSDSGVPEVTMPPDFKEALAAINKPCGDDE